MNNLLTTIPGLINLLKIAKPTNKDKGKVVMVVDSSGSKKSSKNRKKKKSTKPKGRVAKKKGKETTSKDTSFHCHKDGQ